MSAAPTTVGLDRVLDVDLDALLGADHGAHSVAGLCAPVEAALERHDLRVHLIVLCHGADPKRLAATARLCRALGPALRTERVDLTVSYQGRRAPRELTDLLGTGTPVWSNHPRLIGQDGARLSSTGKTEHLLACLARLRAQPGDLVRRFVVFLDGDYLVYDPVNALALYAPWALGFATDDGGGAAEDQFAGVEFAKGGGMRLVVDAELVTSYPERTPGFLDLLDAAMAHTTPHAPATSTVLPPDLVPTLPALRRELAPALYAELAAAMAQFTHTGGRSSRGLSQYLASRSAHPLECRLARFPFLLHGDHGASLAAWSGMRLASGYGLELSFLTAALRPGANRGRVVNAVTLPHAHMPKDDTNNFALGVEMFALVQHLIGASGPRPEETRPAPRLCHASATPLGYRYVDLDPPPRSMPVLYPPLTDMEVRP